ncbi:MULTISPECIES: VCBS repeat-containing protein [Streptomyces]
MSRVVTAAIAVALMGTAAGTAVAAPATTAPAGTAAKATAKAGTAKPKAAPRKGIAAPQGILSGSNPSFSLLAVDDLGLLWDYEPNGRGNFEDRSLSGSNWDGVSAAIQVDTDRDGRTDGQYLRGFDGKLLFYPGGDAPKQAIGPGWNIYDRMLSPGDLGGASPSDILARDKSGVLWLYLARPDNTLSDRIRVGGGWDQYTDIAGRGDLNGDGLNDIVAKDRSGNLWFYKGTGNTNDPFESRVKVGGGWDIYNTLVGTGDVDHDGRSDLLARDKSGVLWLYSGNGNQSDPFNNRTKIGGGWNEFRLMF